jgi:TRAP-type C4-dicarboxylate transport system permease small subunit
VSLPDTQLPASSIPAWLRFAGLMLRTLFIIALIVLTYRVSLPQSETISTAYDTPNDLIRLLLGLGICLWLIVQMFRLPRDVAGLRTWFYVGLGALPFALICLAYIW